MAILRVNSYSQPRGFKTRALRKTIRNEKKRFKTEGYGTPNSSCACGPTALRIPGWRFRTFGQLEHSIGGVCGIAVRLRRAHALNLYARDALAIHFHH